MDFQLTKPIHGHTRQSIEERAVRVVILENVLFFGRISGFAYIRVYK